MSLVFGWLMLSMPLLQCTCLAVSKKWLALGTSAGGLHLIQREGWKQRLILTHKVLYFVLFTAALDVMQI